ncbi:amidase [soil metagenome]
MTSPLTTSSARQLARLIRSGEVSSSEVMETHLSRIEELNPTINAIVALAPDANQRAAEADRQLRRGAGLGPLHGVPFTVKDIIETADLPTTLGLPERAGTRGQRDASIVARMRAAGGILLTKTNCPPGGSGGDTVNDLFGRTRNPYDAGRTAGGSSGGEAAAIAGGMSVCGLGSDSGGSLRVPAHFCGIATLKPTAGRLPLTGILDEDGPIGSMSDPRTQPGPMARRVEDLVLLLGVLAGPDGLDAGVMPVSLGDAATVGLRGLRVLRHVLGGDASPDADTQRTLSQAAQSLTDAGARIVERSLPTGGHELTERIWGSYDGTLSSTDLYDVLRAWDRYRTDMLALLADVDLILSPVAPTPAPAIGGHTDFRYTTPYSLTGWPCVVVRAGTSDGLPVGVQVVAGPWLDHVALAAAARIEADLGGWHS